MSHILMKGTNFCPVVVIGMPHLSLGGLSENWILKECGHRHWVMLASQLGLPTTEFRDAIGNRLYPAFTAVRMARARLALVHEGVELRIESSLDRVSRTQYLSAHSLMVDDFLVAHVSMASVFLRRAAAGTNRQVERAIAHAITLPPIRETKSGLDLLSLAHRFRSGQWGEHLGFLQNNSTEGPVSTFRPCPHNDFNGADFLYFANFQSIVDRAQWNDGPDADVLAPIQHRDIFYYGNIDVGERLKISFSGRQEIKRPNVGMEVRTWNSVFRDGDRKLIADVFTVRVSQIGQIANRRTQVPCEIVGSNKYASLS